MSEALAFAIVSPLHAMMICPPGTMIVCLPTGAVDVGLGVVGGEELGLALADPASLGCGELDVVAVVAGSEPDVDAGVGPPLDPTGAEAAGLGLTGDGEPSPVSVGGCMVDSPPLPDRVTSCDVAGWLGSVEADVDPGLAVVC